MAVDAGTLEGTFEVKDKGTDTLHQVATEVENLGAQMASQGAIAAGVGGAMMDFGRAAWDLVKATAEMVQMSAKAAEEIENMGLRTGFSVQKVQELKVAATESGVGIGALEASILRFERTLGSSSEKLDKWGLSSKALQQMPVEDAFQSVIDKVVTLEDHTQKIALLTDAFGRGGARSLLPMIEAMNNLSDRAQALGAVMTGDQVKSLAAVDNAIDDLGISWDGLHNQMSAVIAANPVIVAGLEDIAFAIGAISNTLKGVDWKGVWADFNSAVSILGDTGIPVLAGVLDNLNQIHRMLQLVGKGAAPAITPALLQTPGTAPGGMQEEAFLKMQMQELAKVGDEIKANNKLMQEQKEHAREVAEALRQQVQEHVAIQNAVQFGLKAMVEGEKARLESTMAAAEAEAKRLAEQEAAAQAVLHAENAKTNEYQKQLKAGVLLLKQQKEQEARAEAFAGILSGISILADAFGDSFGELPGVLSNITNIFKDWGKGLDTNLEKFNAIAGVAGQIGGMIGGGAGAAIQGAAGGAMTGANIGSLLGPMGAVVGGVIGGIGGLIGGIFGNSKKKAEELKKKQDEALKSFEGMFEDWKNARKELAAVGAEGINALLSSMIGADGELTTEFTSVANAAEYAAASFQMLRASGMSTAEALAAMKPGLDALAAAGPEAFAGTGAEGILQMATFAEANAALLQFSSGLGLTAQALSGFGMFTQDLAMRMSLDMNNVIQTMMDSGLSYQQALALTAQDLFNLKQAAENSGVTLDEHTQKMIADAEAAGLFVGLEDPMKKLVEVQQAMLAATGELVKLFGGTVPAAVQKMIDEFNSAKINVNVNVNTGGGGGGGETQPGGEGPGEQFQHGSGGIRDFGSGTLATLHGREGVFTEDQIGNIRAGATEQALAQMGALVENLPSMIARGVRDAMLTSSY